MTSPTANSPVNSAAGGKDRRLGKGLAALLGSDLDLDGEGSQSGIEALHLRVDEIEANPFQPRREFNQEEIASLAESIKNHQQLQPVLVRIVDGRYQLISGERRLRATIHAGLQTIRAEVREADDRLVAELAIIENLQRKDLSPIEKAMSFKRYIQEHKCKQDDLARRLSIDRSTIANLMRLLDLPQPILDMLSSGDISAGHARALLPIGDEQIQVNIASKINDERWSVRATETYVADLLKKETDDETGRKIVNVSRQKRRTITPQVEAMQQEMRHIFGTKVEIKSTARGKGKITIHFADPDEFDRLRDALCQAGSQPPAIPDRSHSGDTVPVSAPISGRPELRIAG
ncbi:MAG: ParB/RepB/Spo0J family partition protein [Planctomycetota bacterium]